ncbi:MAG: methyltransferase domain-containing protein [Leptospiraceae bacterium]|nr:methyltransferase domain-containing protein [Leptospiraceae bacterium]
MFEKLLKKLKLFLRDPKKQTDSIYGFRSFVSFKYLKGNGIEVGALHNPLNYDRTKATVRYVDRMSVQDLRAQYPELNDLPLVNVDIIDNGEKLFTIENDSQDFIIANHMLEHCVNPISTIENFMHKLKMGGVLYLAIPDKRFTFDKNRNLTDFQHLLNDYKNADSESQLHHFKEWVKYCGNNEDKDDDFIEKEALKTQEVNYSIHFHVWDDQSYLNFLVETQKFLKNSFSISFFAQNEDEIISVLKKIHQ